MIDENDYELVDISGPETGTDQANNPKGTTDDDFELVDISEDPNFINRAPANIESIDSDGPNTYDTPEIKGYLRETKNLDEAMELSRNDLSFSLQQTQGMSPAEANRIARLSKKVELPEDVVKSDPKLMEDMAYYNDAMSNILGTNEDGTLKNPKTAEWLKNPNNVKLAKNDYETLLKIEKLRYEQNSKGDNWLQETGRAIQTGSAALGSSLARLPSLAYSIAAIPQNIIAEQFDIPSLATQAPEWLNDNPIATYYDESTKILTNPKTQESIVKQFSEGEVADASYNMFLQAMTNTPVLATMAMGNIAGLSQAATLTGMGSISASDTLNEARKEGKSPLDATTNAIMSGTAEAFFEKYTLDMMGGMFKQTGKELVKTIGKDSAKKQILNSLGAVAKSGVIEGSSEGFTTGAQDLADYLTGDKDALTGVGERMLNASLVGMLPGGTMQMISEARNNVVKTKYLKDQQELMDKQAEALDTTELKNLDPELAENFIENVNGDEKIYISAEKLKSFFQKKDDGGEGVVNRETVEMMFNETIAELGVADQVEQSDLTGSEMEISKAKWLVKFANTDMGKALKDDIRFSVDGLTGKEAVSVKEGAMDTLTEMRDEIERTQLEENTEQIKKLREDIMANAGANFDADGVDQVLAVLLAGNKAFSEKSDKITKSILERYKPEFQNPGVYQEELNTNQEEIPLENLEGDAIEMAQQFIDEELSVMAAEIEASRPKERIFTESDVGGAPEVGVNPSTFPEYFRELGTNKKSFLAAIKRGKGPVYERIKAMAVKRLKEGYTNDHSGNNVPNNDFRSLLNLPGFEGSDTKFTLFQKSNEGIFLKKHERGTKDLKDMKYIPFTFIDVGVNFTKIADQKSFKTERAKFFEAGPITVKSNGFPLRVNTEASHTIIDKIYNSAPDLATKDSKKLKKDIQIFRQKVSAIDHLESFIENAVLVATEDQVNGRDVYFSVGNIGKNNAVVRFRADSKGLIDNIEVEVLPRLRTSNDKADLVQMRDNNLVTSVTDFAQRVNRGRNTKQPRGQYFQKQIEQNKQDLEKQTLKEMNQDELGFYSALESELTREGNKFQFKAIPAANLLSQILKIPGIKEEEIAYFGVEDFLKSKGNEKITKQELLDVMKRNQVKLTQTVLAQDFSGDGAAASIAGVSWGEENYEPPDDYYREDYAENDAIDQLDDTYFQEEEFPKYEKAAREEVESETEAGDVVDEDEIIRRAREKAYNDLYESAYEYAGSEDSEMGSYYVEDSETEMRIEWTAYGDSFMLIMPQGRDIQLDANNIEEAKIQALGHGIEEGLIEYDYDEDGPMYGKEDVKFERSREQRPQAEFRSNRIAEILRNEEALVREKSIEYNKGFEYETAEEFQENVDGDLNYIAEQIFDDRYSAGEYGKVEREIGLKAPFDSLKLIGTEQEGWVLYQENTDREWKIYAPMTEDQVKTQAIETLQEEGEIRSEEAVITTDGKEQKVIDKPVAKANWLRYTQDGGTNYREVLIQLLNNTDTFTEDMHFRGFKDFLVHLRIKDRTNEAGDKIFYLEELQSDWHQLGRETGYKPDQKRRSELSKELQDLNYEKEKLLDDQEYLASVRALESKYDTAKESMEKLDQRRRDIQNDVSNAQREYRLADNIADDEAGFELARKNLEEAKEALKDIRQEIRPARKEVEESARELDLFTKKQTLEVNNKIDTIEAELNESAPDAPFKSTESWIALGMKRGLRLAVEQGYDRFSWTPSSAHIGYWGTDVISWKKVGDTFIVGATEQRDGMADGVNIEEQARLRGDLLEARGVEVKTKEDLFILVQDVLSRERGSRAVKSLTDSIWKDMQANPEGTKTPRQDGLKFMYDRTMQKVLKNILKKIDKDAKIEVDAVYANEDTLDSFSVKITDKMREEILGGQSLFQKGDESVKGLIDINDSKAIIKLFNSADKSSPLHEIGHLFLYEMQRMVESGEANDQTVKDLKVLEAFADGEFNIDGIEKVVRGFENYLLEGKAPSVGLQAAFRSFKTWLSNIYKKIQGLPELNDDVREVFDRMLATEQEIEQVKKYYEQKAGIASLIDNPGPKAKDLEDKKDKAIKTAEELLLSKYMRAYYRAIGGKKVLTEQAKKDINESPIYMAIDEAINSGLTQEDILEYAGELELEALRVTHKGMVKKKSKKPIAELAMEYNFETPLDMIDSFVRSERKSDAIKTRTDELVKQKEQEILKGISDNQGIPGQEEFHNEEQLTYLIAEYELITQQLSAKQQSEQKKVERQIYKDVAIETLMNKSTRMAGRYDLYAKSEQRYANESYDHAKKGNFDKAAVAKRKQILNHIMVQEAVKLRDFKLKAEKKYKSKVFKKRLEKIENDYANIASVLVNRYGLNANIYPAEGEIKLIQDINEALYDQLPAWIESGVAPSNETNWRDMKMSEFKELDSALDSIIHSGKNTLLSLKESEFATIGDVVEASITNMENLKDTKIIPEFSSKQGLYGYMENTVNNVKKAATNALSDVVMFEYLFEELDNFKMLKSKEFGVMRTLFNRGRDAESEYKDIMKKTINSAQVHFDKLNEARERIEKLKGKSFLIDTVPLPEILSENGQDRWTVEKIISLLLNTGNVHNKEVLQNAYSFTPQQLGELSSLFTSEELQAIQGIWNVTDTLYEPLNQANFNIHNRYLPKVQAEQVALIDSNGKEVLLEGGYYPLAFDRNLSDVVEGQIEDDLMKDRSKAIIRSSKPKDGMTKTRTGKAHSLPPLLSLSVWTRHISDTSRYISHAEYLRDMNRITSNEDWKKTVRKKVGKKLYSNIRDWVKYQARPERQINSKWERMLDTQRSMATSVILGANMGVALKQRLSGLSAQTDIGGAWIMKALRDSDLKGSVLGLSSSKMWQEVMRKSKYIRARDGSMDREIRDITTNMSPFIRQFNIPGLDKKVTFKDAKDAMFFLIQANDRAMTGIVWKAAYMKSLDATKNELNAEDAEKKAITYADSVVATTQPSSLPLDLNTLQKSEGAMRLFTAFMTWTFKQGNRFGHKYRAWQRGAITTKEYSQHVILEGLIAPWGATIISSLLLDGELPEWWEYMTSPAEYGISWIPLVRDVPGAIKYRRGVGAIPAFEGANRLVKTGTTAYQWAAGDKEYYDFLWSVGYSLEAMSGIPALKVVKNMNNTRLILSGEKKKKK